MAQMKPFLKNMALSENQVPLFSGLANPFQKKMAGSVPHFPTHLYHIYIYIIYIYIYHTSLIELSSKPETAFQWGRGSSRCQIGVVFYRWILDPNPPDIPLTRIGKFTDIPSKNEKRRKPIEIGISNWINSQFSPKLWPLLLHRRNPAQGVQLFPGRNTGCPGSKRYANKHAVPPNPIAYHLAVLEAVCIYIYKLVYIYIYSLCIYIYTHSLYIYIYSLYIIYIVCILYMGKL